jgi:hypothetical protein
MKRYVWLIGPWVLFLALALGWVAYWNIVAGAAEQRLNAWMDEQRAQGASVSISRIVRHGFPVLLRLELQNAAYAPARGGWRAETPRADLHLNLLNTEQVALEAKAPIALSRADGAVTNIAAGALIAELRTQHGALANAGIEADNLVLDDPAKDGVLRAQKVVLNVRPDPRAAGDYQLAFDAQALSLPRPVRSFEAFGQDVSAMRAAIVVTQGASLLDSSPEDPLGPWRDAGGRLRFEALVLNWGPLQTTGTGEGGLDTERRLEGTLTLPIEHPAPVLTAIASGPNVNDSARQALALLAAAYTLNGDDITLDIDAHQGWLRLEGLTVRPLPPVY